MDLEGPLDDRHLDRVCGTSRGGGTFGNKRLHVRSALSFFAFRSGQRQLDIHKELRRKTLAGILRDAGMTPDELRELL
jgi:hypothetical protein